MTILHTHNNLPQGTWIGDPCHILNNDLYKQIQAEYYETEAGYFLCFEDEEAADQYDELDRDSDDYEEQKEELEEQAIWVTKVATNGDGTYTDENGNEYVIDSGLICAVATADLPVGTDLSLGHVIDDYSNPEEAECVNGEVRIAGLTLKA